MTRSIGLEITALLWIIISQLATSKLWTALALVMAIYQLFAAYGALREERERERERERTS